MSQKTSSGIKITQIKSANSQPKGSHIEIIIPSSTKTHSHTQRGGSLSAGGIFTDPQPSLPYYPQDTNDCSLFQQLCRPVVF